VALVVAIPPLSQPREARPANTPEGAFHRRALRIHDFLVRVVRVIRGLLLALRALRTPREYVRDSRVKTARFAP
jgi:hypothetical protein